ncbi:MAG: SLBB domain-containing protein [Desulfocapsa sp.]|nr:SLBB domain-containing protein [Desulfocapsa sp.]
MQPITQSADRSPVSFRQLLFLCFSLLTLLSGSGYAEDYILGEGDVLKISVYDNEDLLTETRVNGNGFIVMPLIGPVKVGGLTTSAATTKLTNLLAGDYILNPQLTIFIEKFRTKKVTILGHVNNAGIVQIEGPMTLLEVISQAGGLKEGVGDQATIKRSTDSEQEVIVINIRALIEDGDLTQNIVIYEGDSIFIPKGGTCYVTGLVGSSGAYPCSSGSTVLKLITLAGGFTGKASQSSVRIIRLVDNEKTVLKDVDLGTKVLANDIIVVPESFF